jgi:hypothetical protein
VTREREILAELQGHGTPVACQLSPLQSLVRRVTLSIERIPLHKAWLTIPYSVALRSSIDASTDVKYDARGNSRSTSESKDGSARQLLYIPPNLAHLKRDPLSTLHPATFDPRRAGRTPRHSVSASLRRPTKLS